MHEPGLEMPVAPVQTDIQTISKTGLNENYNRTMKTVLWIQEGMTCSARVKYYW